MKSNEHEDVWVHTYCIQCNSGPCALRARRVNGVVVKVEGNPAFEDYVLSGGKVCVTAYGLIQKIYNPSRIKSPLKRTNPQKGKDIDPGWVEISWDEALDIVAAKVKEVRDKGLIDESGYPRLACSTGADGTPPLIGGTLSALMIALRPVDRTLGSGSGCKCEHCEHIYGEMWHKGFPHHNV